MYSICVSSIKICTVVVLIDHIDKVWERSKVFSRTRETSRNIVGSHSCVKDFQLSTKHKCVLKEWHACE